MPDRGQQTCTFRESLSLGTLSVLLKMVRQATPQEDNRRRPLCQHEMSGELFPPGSRESHTWGAATTSRHLNISQAGSQPAASPCSFCHAGRRHYSKAIAVAPAHVGTHQPAMQWIHYPRNRSATFSEPRAHVKCCHSH